MPQVQDQSLGQLTCSPLYGAIWAHNLSTYSMEHKRRGDSIDEGVRPLDVRQHSRVNTFEV